MKLTASDQMEWHDVLNNPPAGPPLRPYVFCLTRTERDIGLTIGFCELLKTEVPNGISKQPSPSA